MGRSNSYIQQLTTIIIHIYITNAVGTRKILQFGAAMYKTSTNSTQIQAYTGNDDGNHNNNELQICNGIQLSNKKLKTINCAVIKTCLVIPDCAQ